MSATAVPLQPIKKGSVLKFWLAIAALILIAFAFARLGGLGQVEVETVEEGSGIEIGENDGVFIEYEGRMKDGTVFDSTEGRGPAPLLVKQTVPGFSEALLQMREGGQYRIRIPARLAYGNDNPTGPSGPLDFDVTVIKVVKDAALQVAAVEAQQAAAAAAAGQAETPAE